MPRDSTITYDRVAAAAAALVAEGTKPTTRILRERLGNIGSMPTVLKHLQTWKANQATPRDHSRTLPEALLQAILHYVDQTTEQATTGLSAELADHQRDMAGLALENDRLASVIDDLTSANGQLKAGMARAEGQAAQLTDELRRVQSELAEARELVNQLRVEQAKTAIREEAIPRLEAELASCRQLYEAERQARVAAEQSAAVSQALKAEIEHRLVVSASPAKAAGKPAQRRAKAS